MDLSDEEVAFLSAIRTLSGKNNLPVAVPDAEARAGINHNTGAQIIEKLLRLKYIGSGGIGNLIITDAGLAAMPSKED